MKRRGVIPFLAAALGLSTLAVVPRAAAAAGQEGLRLVRTRVSLLGTHTWYQQTYDGVDVLDGLVVRHEYGAGDTVTADRRRQVRGTPASRPTVTAAAASRTAGAGAGATSLAILAGADARLVWSVTVREPAAAARVLVDATTGAVVARQPRVRHVDGTGTVFDPNPVVALRDRTLTDQDDANSPEFGPAYRAVSLTHLDGSGRLTGDYAAVGPTDGLQATSPSHAFNYDRSSPFFSQTMAYYHLTRAQDYIQSLGFSQVNAEPQDVIADAFDDDASFYSLAEDAIYLGRGGVDDAEDADIIWHEYGHAIQDDVVPGFGESPDAGAIGEGFSDYWAVTMSQAVNGGFDEACVGDWDAEFGDCLRRVDTNLTVDDRIGFVHYDGQIWSRALWDINQALGRDVANVIILESQFAFTPDISFADAALATVDAATRLFGASVARVVTDAFAARRILASHGRPDRDPRPRPVQSPGVHELARIDTAAPAGGAYVNGFEPYDLTEGSTALFASDVATGGQALFAAASRGAQPLAVSGDPAPGGGIYGLGVAAGPSINASGHSAFTYLLEPFELPFGRNGGVYRSTASGVSAVVTPGVTLAPTGGVFVGASENTSINDTGTVAFAGMIQTDHGIAGGLGVGVFTASPNGDIRPVAVPGQAAPGGVLDFATEPALNTRGDIAFTGHLAGRPCDQPSQAASIGCSRDLFVRSATTGAISRIAGRGDPAPGGGAFRSLSYPVINAGGDVVFRATVLTASGLRRGVYVARGGVVASVATFGQEMPGGGRFVAASVQPGNWDINDRGDVAFSALLDTDSDEDGIVDQGLYRWTAGTLSLVVRSGSGLPDGSVVVALQPLTFLGASFPLSGSAINVRRQVLFQATVLNLDRFFFGTVLYLTT